MMMLNGYMNSKSKAPITSNLSS